MVLGSESFHEAEIDAVIEVFDSRTHMVGEFFDIRFYSAIQHGAVEQFLPCFRVFQEVDDFSFAHSTNTAP